MWDNVIAPPGDKNVLLRRSMTLSSRDVQKNCSRTRVWTFNGTSDPMAYKRGIDAGAGGNKTDGGLRATFLLRFPQREGGTPHEVTCGAVAGGQPGRDESLRVM